MPEDRERAVRTHSVWSGTVSFGLVSIPVRLFPAQRSGRTSLRMLDEDGTPLERRYYDPETDEEVDRAEIVKGYELDDRWVTVTEDDLEAVEPEKSRDIELLQFVDVDELDPVFFERAYFLTPDGGSPKAYSLLARIMEDQGRAGIATFVMRTREYLVAILSENGILRAETLRFHDEVRDTSEIELPDRPDIPGEHVEALRSAIRERTEDALDESALTDRYAERLRALAESKRAKGQGVRELEAAAPGGAEVIDLLEALKESLQGEEPSRAPRRPGDAGTASDASLTELTRDELYERAKQLDITGRSSMNKGQLVEAIRKSA